ncbi:conserved hypothetical protein [Burkholderia cenocepacia]|nr:conserved hypothetical protein [Burkholderia cenocepacia]
MTATKKRKTEKRHVKHASTTGTDQKSLVKAVVQNDSGEWVRPSTGDKFVIDETPKFPEITFEIKTEQPPPYQWTWTITWDAQVSGLREKPRGKKLKTFSDTGSFSINDKTWVADPGGRSWAGNWSSRSQRVRSNSDAPYLSWAPTRARTLSWSS